MIEIYTFVNKLYNSNLKLNKEVVTGNQFITNPFTDEGQ